MDQKRMQKLNECDNYNESDLIIKNYSYIFKVFSPMLLFFTIIAIIIVVKYLKLIALGNTDIGVTFFISIVVVIVFINKTVQNLHGYKKQPPVFVLKENSIVFDSFVDDYRYRMNVKKRLSDITSIQYILNSEVFHSYGKINMTPILKRILHMDLGDLVMDFLFYILSLISLLVSLPIKAFMLLKNQEPLRLLSKNILIKFNDDTALVINTYNVADYEKIHCYLVKKNIQINTDIKISINIKNELGE